MQTSPPAGNVSPNSRAQLQRRRYSSVKYNKLLTSKELENVITSSLAIAVPSEAASVNNNVHQTQSNPIINQNQNYCSSATCSATSATGDKRLGTSVTNTNSMVGDRKSSGGSSSRLTVVQDQSSQERRNFRKTSTGTPPLRNNQKKQKHLALVPPSLHISFDVADSSRNNEKVDLLPLSLSSDNFRHYDYRRTKSGGSARVLSTSPTPLRRGNEFHRQKQKNFLEQSEFAEISANYMRLSGGFQQFRVRVSKWD